VLDEDSTLYYFVNMTLTELLSLSREMKGLSLRQVEAATGLSNAYVCQLESGKAEPSLRTAKALSECYGITLDRMANALPAKKGRK
jgi:transcriptional regulator with XRE-family HTH domain